MANKGQMTGMLGVYLTAAELTYRGFIVSVTSRNAVGADLLVTDQQCKRTWSVQVKTNRTKANFWLLNAHAREMYSDSHIYIFVNLQGDRRPEYIIEQSEYVAANVYYEESSKGSKWYSFSTATRSSQTEDWSIFGNSDKPIVDQPESRDRRFPFGMIGRKARRQQKHRLNTGVLHFVQDDGVKQTTAATDADSLRE